MKKKQNGDSQRRISDSYRFTLPNWLCNELYIVYNVYLKKNSL